MKNQDKINYVELPSTDLAATKAFFTRVFGWTFQDFGPEYSAFNTDQAGLDGGFFQSKLKASTANGSALVVIYSAKLEETLSRVVDAGGVIVEEIFAFPGGRRFQFTEPGGSEFAAWSDKGA